MGIKADIEHASVIEKVGEHDGVEATRLAHAGTNLAHDKALVKKLARKVDFRLLPIILVTHTLQEVDKTTLGYTAVWGLREDLGLTGSQYSWAGAIFYLGYLVWEFSTNVLLQRFKINHFVSITVVLWGAILMCSGATQGVCDLLATRFLLGALESSINPGSMLLYSMYYLRHERPL